MNYSFVLWEITKLGSTGALLVTAHNAVAAGYYTWKLVSTFGSQAVMAYYQGITLIKGLLKFSTSGLHGVLVHGVVKIISLLKLNLVLAMCFYM